MTDEQIKHMVQRFLMWRLPVDFRPGGGISATRPNYGPGVAWEPSGTNLLDARQAEAMVRHMLEGMLPPANLNAPDKQEALAGEGVERDMTLPELLNELADYLQAEDRAGLFGHRAETCRRAAAALTKPAALPKEASAGGTFACPICGKDTPLHHSKDDQLEPRHDKFSRPALPKGEDLDQLILDARVAACGTRLTCREREVIRALCDAVEARAALAPPPQAQVE